MDGTLVAVYEKIDFNAVEDKELLSSRKAKDRDTGFEDIVQENNSTLLLRNIYESSYYNALRINDLNNKILKRSFDIAIGLFVVLFILSWITPIIALLIKIESKGPVFFVQLRSGRDNKPFLCYKFRTMFVNNESDELQAGRNDSRITKIGSFLRKTSLDEFPQFLNVLIGTMTVVGPRPHMLRHTEIYSAMIEKYMERLFVKQGLTGWAQVNGFRGETKDNALMEKRVEYDLWYLENWSMWLDLKIFILTAFSIYKKNLQGY